ncbi:MAG: DUF1080 domain-containing protein [Chitinophagaceae bacterium]
MKPFHFLSCMLAAMLLSTINYTACTAQQFVSLFDGKSFKGWQGDTLQTFRIEDKSIVGGSLEITVPHNEFLCTENSYANFDLKLKFKLLGTGFVNAGVQFRSTRSSNPAYEMIGYQADLGNGYWASLYDESRRNKTLEKPDSIAVSKILKVNDWNDYEIICRDKNIRILLNGRQTVSYTEADATIPQTGLIALQIHGGGKSKVFYKDIFIRRLP